MSFILSITGLTLALTAFFAVFGFMAGRLDTQARYAAQVIGLGALVFIVLLLIAALAQIPVLVAAAIVIAGLVAGFALGLGSQLSR